MTAVKVVINGDPAEVEEGISVAALLEHLRVEPRRVVVEHNRCILRSEELAGAHVAAGDELELVHLVGGG